MPPTQVAKPWYREPWPWYLMFGPFVVIVAGLATAWIAYATNDGLVTDDYYKQGLNVDRTLARNREAERLGIEARARFTAEGVSVGLTPAPGVEFGVPPSLSLTLSHPTRAGLDQTVRLTANNGRYSGNLRLPASGHWLVLIEDEAQSWRVMGNVVLPAKGEIIIGGRQGQAAG